MFDGGTKRALPIAILSRSDKFTPWYFGSYHRDMKVTLTKKYFFYHYYLFTVQGFNLQICLDPCKIFPFLVHKTHRITQ